MKNKNKFFSRVLILFLCGLFGISSTFASTGGLTGTGANAKHYQQKDTLSLSIYKSTNIRVNIIKKQLSRFILNISKAIDNNSNDSKLSEEQKLSVNTRLYSINSKLTNMLNIINGSGSTYSYTGTSFTSTSGTGKTTINSCATVPNLLNLGTITTGTPTSVEQEWIYSPTPGNCTYTCTNGYSGSNCITPPEASVPTTSTSSILPITASCTGSSTIPLLASSTYPGCDTADIIVCTGNNTGYTLSACNVGTNTAGLTTSSYGNYYQWGNNADISYASTSTTRPICTTNSTFSATTYITGYTDWCSTQTDNIWGANGTVLERQGPCAIGYHVPTQNEWSGIVTAGGWGSNGTSMQTALKMPFAGLRYWGNGTMYFQTSNGNYWSSSPSGTNGYNLFFSSGSVDSINNNNRALGFSLRCFKN